MLPGKRPLSTNDDVKSCWYDTPVNSPRKFMCIPNNTPQESPVQSISGSLEPSKNPSRCSPTNHPTFISGDFQNQLLQAFLNKFPDKMKPKGRIQSSWITVPSIVPRITLSPDKYSLIDKCGRDETELSLKSLESYDLCVSRSFSEMELDQNNSFIDRISNMATCASDQSNNDSLSDFEKSFSDDDTSRRTRSMSLEDLDYRKSNTWSGFDLEDLRWRNKASSLEDLQDVSSKFVEFEITL